MTAIFAAAALAWIPLLVLAVTNELLFLRLLRERATPQQAIAASLPTLLALIAGYSAWAVHYLQLQAALERLAIGLVWVLLTVAFEFLFWHFVGKKPWAEIGARFNPRSGDGTLVLLLIIALTPAAMGWLLDAMR
ncbi:MAG: hypothetical protein R3E54_11500 [Halioglobus sp.]